MPKKKTKLAVGTLIQVKSEVTVPEYPDVIAAGWQGTIVETKGRGSDLKYIIEWSEQTVTQMPSNYVEHCESTGLYYQMACFPAESVEEANSES